jgi:hypothetical protein
LNEFSLVEPYVGQLNEDIWKTAGGINVCLCTFPSHSLLNSTKVLVLVNHTMNESMIQLNLLCRANNTKLVVVEVWGLCGVIVCDFGESFTYINSSGKEYLDVIYDHTSTDPEENSTMV